MVENRQIHYLQVDYEIWMSISTSDTCYLSSAHVSTQPEMYALKARDKYYKREKEREEDVREERRARNREQHRCSTQYLGTEGGWCVTDIIAMTDSVLCVGVNSV